LVERALPNREERKTRLLQYVQIRGTEPRLNTVTIDGVLVPAPEDNVRQVKLGPEFAVADGSGYVYDNVEDASLVLKINARSLKVEERWPTAPCASPSSMAMDRPNRRLFLGCRSKVMAVMNADTGQVITTLPIGDHVDATAFDPESRLIFNSNGEGTITVIHQDSPDKYSPVEDVKTLPKAKTMALDPKTHRLFLSTAEAGQFEVLVVGQ
jgi:DNA-binding beta-propeller fold protein YncE